MACNVYVFEQFPDLRTGIRHAYPGGAKREGPSGLTPTYAQKRNNMLSQVKPPFRAEHIGSLLRPTALLQQRAKFARGEIDAATLGKAEDQAIKDALVLQERIGFKCAKPGPPCCRLVIAIMGGCTNLSSAVRSASPLRLSPNAPREQALPVTHCG